VNTRLIKKNAAHSAQIKQMENLYLLLIDPDGKTIG